MIHSNLVVVSQSTNDWLEYHRLLKEEKATKEKIQFLEDDANTAKNFFDRATEGKLLKNGRIL